MISIEVIVDDGISESFPLDEKRIKDYSEKLLNSSGITDADVNVIFVGTDTMAELNTTYKGKDGATDVLSFNLSEDGQEILEGEVYVCLECAKTQAEENGVPYPEEIVRLFTHGLLHLCGRMHDTEEEYASMMAETEKLINEFFGDNA